MEELAGQKTCLVEAIFDNDSDWPDELAFKKGDLLAVIDRQEDDFDNDKDSWWSCSDRHGRRGIVPANRVRIMHGIDGRLTRVVTPRRFGDVFLYSNSTFPRLDDQFPRHSPAIGLDDSLSSLKLLHGPEKAFPLSSLSRFSSLPGGRRLGNSTAIVHDIPIHIEGDRMKSHRSSPPPPLPHRKCFGINTRIVNSDEEHGQNEPSRMTADRQRPFIAPVVHDGYNYGIFQVCPSKPKNNNNINDVIPDNERQRDSVTSSVSLSASISEHSSLSDPPTDHNGPSAGRKHTLVANNTYDMPIKLKSSMVDIKKDDEDRTSLVIKTIEGLYDVPNKTNTDKITESNFSSRRPWTIFRRRKQPRNREKEETTLKNNTNTSSSPKVAEIGVNSYKESTTPSDDNPVLTRLLAGEHRLEMCSKKMDQCTAPRSWREPHVLQKSLMDIRDIVSDANKALQDFVDATARLAVERDSKHAEELSILVSPLRASKSLMSRLKKTLDSTGWTLTALSKSGQIQNPVSEIRTNDALDQFVAVIKQIPANCHQMTRWASKNPHIVFISSQEKIENDTTGGPPNLKESLVMEEDDLRSIFDDYDYVDGEQKGHSSPTLLDEDRQLLDFYWPQIATLSDCLSDSIEAFLSSVEEQRPPKEFVQRSKLVILAAHKLVYIGDNVTQCVTKGQMTVDVRKLADRLCSVLKECVSTTRIAADTYPKVSTVQKMVDSVVDVSHAAHDLKLLIKQSIATH